MPSLLYWLQYFQQNGNFNASTDQQSGNFTMYRCLRPCDIQIPLDRLCLPCQTPQTMQDRFTYTTDNIVYNEILQHIDINGTLAGQDRWTQTKPIMNFIIILSSHSKAEIS